MSCASAQKTITAIYSAPEIDDCISKLVRQELRNDFKQELFLILLGVPCERVDQMNGTFKYFVVRIILNLCRQKRNIFHKTYLDKTVEYNTDKLSGEYQFWETGYKSTPPSDRDIMSERMARENKEEQTIMRLVGVDVELGNQEYPYHEAIIKLVAESDSLREASRKTGIPRSTITRTINRVREHLK